MTVIDDPGSFFLERAEEAGGAGSVGYAGLDLSSLRVNNLSVDIDDAILGVSCTRTVEGASTLVITLDDPDLAFLRAPIVDLDVDGQLDPLLVELDLLRWRLVKTEADWSASTGETKLTCEEEAVALLRAHNAPFAMSRARTTRAQFAHRLVREVQAYPLGFYSPEENFQQSIEQPTSLRTRDAQRQSGLPANIKVQGWSGTVTLDAPATGNASVALREADSLKAPERAVLALLEAQIVEGPFFANPIGGEGTSSGILQLTDAHLNGSTSTRGGRRDIALVTRLFLTDGFTGQGGAITLASQNPDWSTGQIAQAVQGSAFPTRYQQSEPGAMTVYKAWTGGTGGSSSGTRTTIKPYVFRRGLPGKRETSWDCLQRLASEVGWRCFCVANVVYFISEEQLFMSRARAEISLDTPGVNSLKGDLDQGKNASQVTLNVDAGAWSFPPGSVVALRDLGVLTGRWLVETIDRPELTDPATDITLSRPIARKREPAADTIQVPRDSSKDGKAANVQTKTASYPLAKKGQVIGTPFKGTHAVAFNRAGGSDNWESENAVDIGVPTGTRVYAVDDGTIGQEFGPLSSSEPRMAGIRLHLKTAHNEWYYAHLKDTVAHIGPGVSVKAGDLLGHSGAANGVEHLHIASEKGDPLKLLGLS